MYDDDEGPFVQCGNDDCTALKEPTTYDEVVRALEHWQSHSLMGGCSHGC